MTTDLNAIAAFVQTIAIIGGGFYFTGRITAVLEELRRLTADHEARLRALESTTAATLIAAQNPNA